MEETERGRNLSAGGEWSGVDRNQLMVQSAVSVYSSTGGGEGGEEEAGCSSDSRVLA